MPDHRTIYLPQTCTTNAIAQIASSQLLSTWTLRVSVGEHKPIHSCCRPPPTWQTRSLSAQPQRAPIGVCLVQVTIIRKGPCTCMVWGFTWFRVEGFGIYIAPKGISICLLWGPSIYYTATWTLWASLSFPLGALTLGFVGL